MGRGVLLALVLVLAAVGSARAQTASSHRIGFLRNSTPALEANLIGPFRDGLRQLGYVEGVNSHVEYRWAGGDYARFPGLVAELARQRLR